MQPAPPRDLGREAVLCSTPLTAVIYPPIPLPAAISPPLCSPIGRLSTYSAMGCEVGWHLAKLPEFVEVPDDLSVCAAAGGWGRGGRWAEAGGNRELAGARAGGWVEVTGGDGMAEWLVWRMGGGGRCPVVKCGWVGTRWGGGRERTVDAGVDVEVGGDAREVLVQVRVGGLGHQLRRHDDLSEGDQSRMGGGRQGGARRKLRAGGNGCAWAWGMRHGTWAWHVAA